MQPKSTITKFSIYLPTYNRHELVARTLESLSNQTYANFEVLLYDNGSDEPVKELVESYMDKRFIYTRLEKNQHTSDLAEDSLNRMSGTHFLFLADDDVLVPRALEIVAKVFHQHGVDILQTGYALFNHMHRTVDLSKAELDRFSGTLEELDAKEAALHFCNGWGIGPKCSYKAPRMAHSSGLFISKALVDKTRNIQRELFIKPFGDIGYVGALLNATKYCYLDLPLAIIGETQVREMNGSKPGQRQKWEKEIQYLEHSPIKGSSFQNMGTDAHLKVLIRNHWEDRYDCQLRPSFYRRHLKQVLADSPKTLKTVRDSMECIPLYAISILRYFSLSKLRESLFKHKNKTKASSKIQNKYDNTNNNDTTISHHSNELLQFNNINRFAEWLNINYVMRLEDRID